MLSNQTHALVRMSDAIPYCYSHCTVWLTRGLASCTAGAPHTYCLHLSLHHSHAGTIAWHFGSLSYISCTLIYYYTLCPCIKKVIINSQNWIHISFIDEKGNCFSHYCFPLFCRQSLHFSKKVFLQDFDFDDPSDFITEENKFAVVHLKPHFCLKAKVKVNRKLWDVSSKVCNPRFQKQRPCCEYPWLSGIKLWLPHFPSLLQSPSQDWLSPSVSVSLMPGPSVHTSRLLHQASCREPCFCCLIVLIAMWYHVFSYFLSLLSPLLYTLASYFNWFICNCFIKIYYFAPALLHTKIATAVPLCALLSCNYYYSKPLHSSMCLVY